MSDENTVHPFSIVGIARFLKSLIVELGSNWLIAYRRWQRDDVMSLAAAVSFYLSLSIFPMLLLLTGGVGLVMPFADLTRPAPHARPVFFSIPPTENVAKRRPVHLRRLLKKA